MRVQNKTRAKQREKGGKLRRRTGAYEEASLHRKKTEAALSLELDFNRALADLASAVLSSRSIYDISSLVLDEAKRLTRSRVGYAGFIDPQTNFLVCPALSGELRIKAGSGARDKNFAQFGGMGRWVLDHRKPILINNVKKDSRYTEELPCDFEILHYLSAPAMKDSNLLGQVAVANPARHYGEQDLVIIQRLATFYAIAIDHEMSERSYRAIFDAANDGIAIQDTESGIIDEVNYKFCEMFGYAPLEARRLTVGDVSVGVPPFTEEVAQENIRRAAKEGPLIFDWLAKDKDGRRFWVEVNLEKAVLRGKERIVAVVRDISERKQAEEKLRESEHKYKTLFEDSRDAIFLLYPDKYPDKRLVGGNPAAVRMFGCTSEAELGRHTLLNLSSLYQPDGSPTPKKAQEIIAILEQKGTHSFEWKHRRINGEEFLASVLTTRMELEGKLIIHSTVRDITEQKKVEEALQESEERFRSIFVESPIGIMIYDAEGRWLDANRSSLQIFRVSDTAEIEQTNLFESPFLPEGPKIELRALQPVRYEVLFDCTKTKWRKIIGTSKAGTLRLDIGITPIAKSQTKSFGGFLVQVQDISEKRQAEEQIHALTQKILETQEDQRRKISRELHDRVAQDLSLLKMGLETLGRGSTNQAYDTNQQIASLSKTLEGTIAGVRDLAYYLHPPGLDQLGLVRAIRQYCEDFTHKAGINVKFYSVGLDERRLPFQTEINLFRLTQEALSNVRNHAEAKNVTIQLAASFPNVILRITDDGKGFNVRARLAEALREKRMGIKGMQERVNLIKGEMKLYARPMQGTKIVVEVPFKEERGGS